MRGFKGARVQRCKGAPGCSLGLTAAFYLNMGSQSASSADFHGYFETGLFLPSWRGGRGYNPASSMTVESTPEANPIPPDANSTFQLVERVRAGDSAALEVLFGRYLVPLQRWAKGRLPAWARNATDTHDLVQDTLLNVFRNIETFEPRGEGAFQAYLRQAVMNRIRDRIRRTATSAATTTLDENAAVAPGSQFEDFVGLQTLERYEAALARLSESDREAIIGRVEFGNSYDELAKNLNKPSPDAARMAVARALLKLAEEMKRGA